MRSQIFASTTSRVFGNRQDSRIVAGTNDRHALVLAWPLPVWHVYAEMLRHFAMAIARMAKDAIPRLAAPSKRSRRTSTAVRCARRVVRPASRASVVSA